MEESNWREGQDKVERRELADGEREGRKKKKRRKERGKRGEYKVKDSKVASSAARLDLVGQSLYWTRPFVRFVRKFQKKY